MKRGALKVQIVKHEGLKLKPYRDTVGKLTIGVGRNLDDRGISADEAAMLLDNDIDAVWKELSAALPGVFTSLDDTRQHVMLDMAFNMGVPGLMKFQKMIKAVAARDFALAAVEMLDSKWAKQVGERADNLAAMMRNGPQ